MNIFKRFYIACRRFGRRRGYGIHPPFAYDLITDVIYGRYAYYAYDDLRKLCGAIPGNLLRYPRRVNELLFRLVNRFQPELVVEVGTGSGLSMCYMAAAKKNARYVTIDRIRHDEVAALLGNTSVEYRTVSNGNGGLFQNFSSINLLHMAHTSDYETVWEEALLHVSPESLFLVEGIYDSKLKRDWWKRVVADDRTGITFDLYEIGLVFFDKSRPKQHFKA